MRGIEIYTEKAENYSRYRPNYSIDLINRLYSVVGIHANSYIADIGSGTGIFTRQLLERGSNVYAIEPNDSMRAIAENELSRFNNFYSINSTGEYTTLQQSSVDFVTVAQAFHWLNIDLFKLECKRILKSKGKIIIVYNRKKKEADINKELSQLLKSLFPEYKDAINHWELREQLIISFFDSNYEFIKYENDIINCFDEFVGRSLSHSYSKFENKYINEIKKIFFNYSMDGIVHVPNETIAYIGTT